MLPIYSLPASHLGLKTNAPFLPEQRIRSNAFKSRNVSDRIPLLSVKIVSHIAAVILLAYSKKDRSIGLYAFFVDPVSDALELQLFLVMGDFRFYSLDRQVVFYVILELKMQRLQETCGFDAFHLIFTPFGRRFSQRYALPFFLFSPLQDSWFGSLRGAFLPCSRALCLCLLPEKGLLFFLLAPEFLLPLSPVRLLCPLKLRKFLFDHRFQCLIFKAQEIFKRRRIEKSFFSQRGIFKPHPDVRCFESADLALSKAFVPDRFSNHLHFLHAAGFWVFRAWNRTGPGVLFSTTETVKNAQLFNWTYALKLHVVYIFYHIF